ncbi:MAG: hypothetical protein WBG90_09020, partial [Saonia sp.]
PLITTMVSHMFKIENLFLVAIALLMLSLLSLQILLRRKGNHKCTTKGSPRIFKNGLLNKKHIFNGIRLVLASKYLQSLAVFMILYTSISTFLYFQQAHIVENTLATAAERIGYFSKIDLITNFLAIIGQFFLTNRIIGKFGLAVTLCSVPVCIAIGFIVLSLNTVLVVVAVLMIMHRAGNFIVLRPGREMLYTICSREEKYKAKNFMDTAVYRGGDALSGWTFAGLFSLGFEISVISIVALPLLIFWSYTGFQLGKKADKKADVVIPIVKANK